MKYLTFRIGLFLVLLITVFNAAAKQGTIKLTPFTGMDFVCLVVDKIFRQAPETVFKVIIRSLDDSRRC